MKDIITETDLILNTDGSIYHLNLLPGDIAETIITVGDPDRVGEVSQHFDRIELKKGKREFITHTGMMHGRRLSVISTGIGTDNIDIVFNELDALANINFGTRKVNKQLKSLNLIRIGTSGAIQPDIPVDSLLVSEAAFGLDPLMHYYHFNAATQELAYAAALSNFILENQDQTISPYFVKGSRQLIENLANDLPKGITVTAPGFYAPQGRQVRAKATMPGLLNKLANFNYEEHYITNLEMETAGIYGMARALAHQAISFNVILANRATNVFSKNPAAIMEKAIANILARVLTI